MIDNYSHSDNELVYVVENIPGPVENTQEYETLIQEFNSQLTNHCSCEQFCENECVCLQSSGGQNYVADICNNISKYRLNLEGKDVVRYPVIECNALCLCLENCGNRVVQNGPIDGLVVRTCSESKGLGLFTESIIVKGTFICEYAGEIITKAEAHRRHFSNNLEGRMNFIYCLKEHSGGAVKETFIDPSKFGNIGRYINHSCDPNCMIIPVRVDSPIPKLAIFSSKYINPDSELTYDYGSGDSTSKSDVVDVSKRIKCLCESQKCRGWIPFESY